VNRTEGCAFPLLTHPTIPATLVLLLLSLAGCSKKSEWSAIGVEGQTMGTTYSVKVAVQPDEFSESFLDLRNGIEEVLEDVNSKMSTYDTGSELSRFNIHDSTGPFSLSPETMAVVRAAAELFEQTGGAFDPTVGPLVDLWGFGPTKREQAPPPQDQIEAIRKTVGMDLLVVGAGNTLAKKNPALRIDLSGIAKGFGVDQVAEHLSRKGYDHFMVEIGGEVRASGVNQRRRPWNIGIDRPTGEITRSGFSSILGLSDKALATSGDYRNYFEHEGLRYTHILDPSTGRPVPKSIGSVSVVASTCMRADGAATAIMVMGATRGLEWATRQDDLEALLLVRGEENDFTEKMTPGMKSYLSR